MADIDTASDRPKLKRKEFEDELGRLQHELVVLQEYIKAKGLKVVVIFEGRDAAGKGGVIKRITERTSPRSWRVAALAAPTERERTQWYFQRYVAHLPAAGEVVLFDRSWYNRAGVERVMGFCTEEEYQEFMRSCPEFERMLVRVGDRAHQVLVLGLRRGAGAALPGAPRRPDAALEAQPDGPRRPRALGRLLAREGRDVHAHRHQAGAVVRRRRRRQAPRAPELHRAPAVDDPLRGRDPAAAGASAAPAGPVLHPAAAQPTRRSCPRSTDRFESAAPGATD